jgi:hypothetical protein
MTNKIESEQRITSVRSPGQLLSPMTAIRSKCLDCCGGSSKEVGLCPCTACPLWAHRFGTGVRARKIVREERERKDTVSEGTTHWAEQLPDYTQQNYYRTACPQEQDNAPEGSTVH